MAAVTAAQLFGARLLNQIANEEGSLDDVVSSSSLSFQLTQLLVQILKELRTIANPRPSRTGIPSLDDLWRQHGSNSKLNITGRGLPLLYHLLTILLTKLHGTIALYPFQNSNISMSSVRRLVI
ncbi:hypothetical protein D0Z07_0209 [Hyphodiscus hymeniophilus]|uniref:Uncharacterized protein n=1 Tax=Hyphodiscus hymeniophilus TaxID=353542 RepID=A0A9P6VS23_9HELO|nr:hypothetical protein D0Z07_0209 [Hyphodiscus hymeniophilus]